MEYYLLKPEIAGELGDSSEIIYEDGRIKEVKFLEFVFRGWLGDEILKARPCYIVTEDIMDSFLKNGITGVRYENIKISFSEEFIDIYENTSEVPAFVRIIPLNRVDELEPTMVEDVYLDKYNRLIVSEKTLKILRDHKLDNCDIEQV